MADDSNMPEMPMTADRGERGFLHDISSPLAVGQGNLRIIISKLKADPPAIAGAALVEKLEKVQKAMDKIILMVSERRLTLRADPSEPVASDPET